ncbi:hypothetical protein CPB86DRAFT_815845 [Serendipita vermifera]|nr:hypothetical protein CPB86DRAFT_815845 [Serendipita vermifera]
MTLSTRLFILSAVALQAFGLVVPRGDFQADIVPTISCSPADGFPRPMVIKSTTVAEQQGKPVLDAEGVKVAIRGNVLAESFQSGSFIFQTCESTFMNLSPSTEDGKFISYGHVVDANDISRCLTSITNSDDPQDITAVPCSISDDSGQILQFWKLTVDTADPTSATLDFVGKRAESDATGFYATDFNPGLTGRFPQIQYVRDGTDYATPYQLTFV